MKKILIILIFGSLILVGCQNLIKPFTNASETISERVEAEQKKQSNRSLAIIKCQELCQEKITEGVDITNGPCLSNEIVPDWVCDVAHSPRQEVDNDPVNQCSAFREGKAHHFVEVDGNCNVIKTR